MALPRVRLNKYVHGSQSSLELILRGHLWVESVLNGLIEAGLDNPQSLNIDRMSVAAKINLAHAIGMLEDDELPWLRKLNSMRNRLAHDIDGEPTDKELDALEATMGPRTRRRHTEMVGDSDYIAKGRLSLAFTAHIVPFEYRRLLKVYEREHKAGLMIYRMLHATADYLGNEVTAQNKVEWREQAKLPPFPTISDTVDPPFLPREQDANHDPFW